MKKEQNPLEWALSMGEQCKHSTMQAAGLDLAAKLNHLADIVKADVCNNEDLGVPQKPIYWAIDWALSLLKNEVIPEFEAVLTAESTRAS